MGLKDCNKYHQYPDHLSGCPYCSIDRKKHKSSSLQVAPRNTPKAPTPQGSKRPLPFSPHRSSGQRVNSPKAPLLKRGPKATRPVQLPVSLRNLITVAAVWMSFMFLYWGVAFWSRTLSSAFSEIPSTEYLSVNTQQFSTTALFIAFLAVYIGGRRLQLFVVLYTLLGGVLLSFNEHGTEIAGRLPRIPQLPLPGIPGVQGVFSFIGQPEGIAWIAVILISSLCITGTIFLLTLIYRTCQDTSLRKSLLPTKKEPVSYFVFNSLVILSVSVAPSWIIGYFLIQTDLLTTPRIVKDLPVNRELIDYFPPMVFTGLLVLAVIAFLIFLAIVCFDPDDERTSSGITGILLTVYVFSLSQVMLISYGQSEEASMRKFLETSFVVDYCSSASFIYQSEQWTLAALKDPLSSTVPGEVCTDIGVFRDGVFLSMIDIPSTMYFTDFRLANMKGDTAISTEYTQLAFKPTSLTGVPEGEDYFMEITKAVPSLLSY